jgi:hypothetical protein
MANQNQDRAGNDECPQTQEYVGPRINSLYEGNLLAKRALDGTSVSLCFYRPKYYLIEKFGRICNLYFSLF